MKRVSIVIPAWNGVAHLKTNMPSVLAAAEKVHAEILVVEDASKEQKETVELLKSLSPAIKILCNDKNLGFSPTVNRGVEAAGGDIVVLLNTDVRPEKDSIANALSAFVDPDLFAVHLNSGEGWGRGEWKDGLLHHFRQDPVGEYDRPVNPSLWASGGQGVYSKRKWDELGGLDPLFAPFYWEDVDLGYRAWKRGWRIIWKSDCRVVHDHAKSVIANSFKQKLIENTAFRNHLIFMWKNIHDRNLLLDHLKHLPKLMVTHPYPCKEAVLRLPKVLDQRKIELSHAVRKDADVLRVWNS